MKTNKIKLNKGFTRTLSSKVSGFTIIETLVAVFILSIAITAFMTLTASSIMTARYARNEITANYLAQEAADYIRNQRDTLAFSDSGDWDKFIKHFNKNNEKTCFKEEGCYFSVKDNSSEKVRTCDKNNGEESGCPFLKYRNDGNSFYYYSSNSGNDSVFKRTIIMKDGEGTAGTHEVYVTITIDWKNGNASKSKVLNFSLLNWYGVFK